VDNIASVQVMEAEEELRAKPENLALWQTALLL
jgi:hypothetical protein